MTICALLLAILMTSLYFVLVGGLRHHRLTGAQQEAQQEAMVGMRRISAELTNTHQGAFTHGIKPVGYVIFISADEPLPVSPGNWTYENGTQLLYKKWVCFFHDPVKSELRRSEIGLKLPSASPSTLPIPTIDQMMVLRSERFISGATSFLVSDIMSGVLGVELVVERQTGTQKSSGNLQTTSIRVRNF